MKKWRPKLTRSTRKRRPSHATTSASRAHTYHAGSVVASACHHPYGCSARRCSAKKSWTPETSPSTVHRPTHLKRARIASGLLFELRAADAVHDADHAPHCEPDDEPFPRAPPPPPHQ